MKECIKCGFEGQQELFIKGKNICKICKAEWRKIYREINREKITECKRIYREANKNKITEYKKTYRKENKKKIAESAKKYREENRKKEAQRKRKYREENPEKMSTCRQNRRALVKNAQGSFTAKEWAQVKELQNHKCYGCGIKCNLTIDHIVALSNGGVNYIQNIAGLCFSCNSSKNAKDVWVWLDVFDL